MLLQCLALTSLKSGGGDVTAVFGSVTSLLNLERVGCYCSVWLCD